MMSRAHAAAIRAVLAVTEAVSDLESAIARLRDERRQPSLDFDTTEIDNDLANCRKQLKEAVDQLNNWIDAL